jgi:myosin-5
LESNPVLEAFGNAKTIRNDNSSRFGKFIRIVMEEHRISGCRIDHFLLEKSRIVQQAADERNYHIFYQLCAGCSDEEKASFGLLPSAKEYLYLSQSGCMSVDGIDDHAEYAATRRAMGTIGLGTEEQDAACRVISAVLLLGNVAFEEDATGTGAASGDKMACKVADLAVVTKLSELLGVRDTFLKFGLTKRTVSAGRGGSTTEVPLTVAQAEDSRNGLAKAVYQRLFHWLVCRINESIAVGGGRDGSAIGILDIYGFEILQSNSFEQLCINFANEMLQQQFNEEVFVAEQQTYVREGLNVKALHFADNAACLELIRSKPLGILLLLDEESMLGRASDSNLLKRLHQVHLDKHPNYSKPRFASPEFIVHHFAGPVTYDVTGFVDKNNDALTHDLTSIITATNFPFLATLFEYDLSASSAASGGGGGAAAAAEEKKPYGRATRGTQKMATAATVSSRYRKQLADLHQMLSSCSPHYVRCIKPNNLKFPGGFESVKVLEQLRYSGVLETVRIRRQGFPVRVEFQEFVDRYRLLLPTADGAAAEGRSGTEAILRLLPATEEGGDQEWQIGKTRLFLRDGQMDLLDAMLRRRFNDAATVIQARVRERLERRSYQRTRRGFRAIQGTLRRMVARRRFAERLGQVVAVQRLARTRVQQWRYKRTVAAAQKLNAVTRGMLARRVYGVKAREDRRAVQIQTAFRARAQRQAYVKTLEKRDVAAKVISNRVKGLAAARQFQRQKAAVVNMQRAARGFADRNRYLRGKEMAVVAQAKLRAIMQRMAFRKQKRAALKISTLFRMIPHRRAFWASRDAATKVQAHMRRTLETRRFDQAKRGAVLLQSSARKQAANRVANGLRRERDSATLVQSCHRGRVERRGFAEKKKASTTIASHCRGFLGNKEYRQRRTAAKRIQVLARDWSRRCLLKTMLAVLAEAARTGDVDRFSDVIMAFPQLLAGRALDARRQSLLHSAAVSGSMSIAKILLEPATFDAALVTDGCQLRAETFDIERETALHISSAGGHVDLSKYLLNRAGIAEAEMLAAADAGKRGPSASQHMDSMQPVRTSSRSTALKTAWLKKRRPYSTRWQNRYFTLHSDSLAYFHGTKDKAPRGVISLQGAMLSKSTQHKHTFELQHPSLAGKGNVGGIICLKAKSEAGMHDWIGVLRNIPGVQFVNSRFKVAGEANDAPAMTNWATRRVFAQSLSTMGETPLHRCAEKAGGDMGSKVASVLVANGAEIDFPDNKGRTPLHAAVAASNVSLVTFLVKHGADINRKDGQGNSAFDLARSQRVQRLLVVSALPTSPTFNGDRPKASFVRSVSTAIGRGTISTGGESKGGDNGRMQAIGTMVSICFEKIGIANAESLEHPFLVATLYDGGQVVEAMPVPSMAVLQTAKTVWFESMWHLLTPMEQLSEKATVIVEIRTPHGKKEQVEAWTSIPVR